MLTTRRARILTAAGLALLIRLTFPTPPASAEPQNVLILHAFEANMPINVMTSQGLMPTLEAGGLGVQNQFFEHLDLARNPGPEHRRDLAELMGHRYRHRKIDLIITLYPEALQFVLNEGQALFSDAPVLALYLPPGMRLPRTDRLVIRHSLDLDLRGRDFSFDLRTFTMQAESGDGKQGLTFDDYGRKFVCTANSAVQFLVYEDRYANRNPFYAPPRALVDVALEPGETVYRQIFLRIIPEDPWRRVRNRWSAEG